MDDRTGTGEAADVQGGIDWTAVRTRLARQGREAEEAAAPGGAWADALLLRRAEDLARVPSADEANVAADAEAPVTLLVGRGADGSYGLDLRHLSRIVPLPRVARVPHAPPELLGLIAIDGRVMRLFDVDRLCGRNAVPAGGGFAVVLRGGERPVALRLRTVDTVTELDGTDRKAPPEAGSFVTAITRGRVAVLDVPAILETLRSMKEE
ncbi:purine-binding chemotaxis protein CheW [Azospirillum sp. OGB3]|uniref:chemotaxis protein CheW n=1 Tax=Azospirillum sp. OGB3 TaxID=2587012 RepID=UPI00160626E7|nr:chemotaxis protein CheW [Azospirillum sp. OGB3]MBB3267355.1 purine-binding chemotaxis protein CheW [Azospirillum sp. OGB3]